MDRTKKLLIAIIIIVVMGLIAIIAGALFIGHDVELTEGNRNILVCAIDESETRPGMGACDMAFVVTLNNGTLKNYTAIYPGGLTHPSAKEPAEAQAQGAGAKLLLHDAYWSKDNGEGMKLAKEIVEYNTHIKIDSVVAVNTEALDAVLNAAGQVDVNGTPTNISSIDIIREDNQANGVSRGNAVLNLVKAAAQKSKDPDIKAAMVNAALDQYAKGNIIMDQQGAFAGLLASKGIETFFG